MIDFHLVQELLTYIATHLVVVVLLLVFLEGGTKLFKKRPRLYSFKWDRDEICQNCSSSKYASSESDF